MADWSKKSKGYVPNGNNKGKVGTGASSNKAPDNKGFNKKTEIDSQEMEGDEFEMEYEDMEFLASEEFENVEGGAGEPEVEPGTTISYTQWERPPVPKDFNSKKIGITFQQLDMDHYIGKPIPGMPGAKIGPVPVIR